VNLGLYKLVDRKPVACTTPGEWGRWYSDHLEGCQVAIDRLFEGKVRVSTVFLGTDISLSEKPRLFETMIFGGPASNYQAKYETWEQAEVGHVRAVAHARKAGAP
jgi:hypothetical protein